MKIQPLFNVSFLASKWESEYQTFKESKQEEILLEQLRNWAARRQLNETATEAAFIQVFFCDIWEYAQQGANADGSYQCYPQFPVARAGQSGGTGKADLALGYFGLPGGEPNIPQIVCEFKDIRSRLDSEQHRKGNTRSPVRQCMDYLREAGNDLTGNELVAPFWGIVMDMNEFRLYCRTKGDTQCQRFVILPGPEEDESLLADSETSAFLRFLFRKIFHRSSLLAEQDDPYLKKFTAKKLASKLLALRKTSHSPLKDRFVSLDAEIVALDEQIAAAENAMNEFVHGSTVSPKKKSQLWKQVNDSKI